MRKRANLTGRITCLECDLADEWSRGRSPECTALAQRVAAVKPDEVVMAVSPSVEGDVTMHVVADFLKEINPNLLVTRIAFGLPDGSDLEYADEVTLARAFEVR